MVSEDRNPLESALDVFVYAPLGLFITVTEEMPRLVEKGRQRLTSQLGLARMMGEMAAPQVQSEAGKLMRNVVDRLSAARPSGPAPVTPRPHPPSAPASGAGAAPTGAGSLTSAPAGATPSPNGSAVAGRASDSTHLAIPGYDTLSAMQVVQRLAGLSPEELEAVRAYESAHRGRKTILNRAEQLLSDPAG